MWQHDGMLPKIQTLSLWSASNILQVGTNIGLRFEFVSVGILLFLEDIALGLSDDEDSLIEIKSPFHDITMPVFHLEESEKNDSVESKLKRLDFHNDPVLGLLAENDENQLGSFGFHVQKREVISLEEDGIDPTKDFIEEKLVEQGQALEHLVKMVRKNEEVTKQLLEHLSKLVDKPKLPEKLEPSTNRRSFKVKQKEENENPFVRLGKSLPLYGTLLKDLVAQQIQGATDPVPLIEVANK